MYWITGTAVDTIPEGIVKGPDKGLPRNCVFTALDSLMTGYSCVNLRGSIVSKIHDKIHGPGPGAISTSII